MAKSTKSIIETTDKARHVSEHYDDYIECIPIDDCDLSEGIDPKWEDEEPIEIEVTFSKISKN